MTDITKLISETEALLAAGTQDELTAHACDYMWIVCASGKRWDKTYARAMSEPDARLFAAAPTALRALIAECKRLQDDVEYLESQNQRTW